MSKTIQLFLIIVLLFSINTYLQNAEIDSLEILLENHSETDTTKVNLLNDIAFKIRFYDLEKTIQYAKNADSISEILNYKKGNAVSLKIQGVYYFSQSDFDKAMTCYEKSIQICEEINDLLTMASCYNNIGNIYRIQGNYPRSLENYQKALSLFEETGKEYYAAVSYLNIAILQGALGNKEEQLEGYLKAADYFDKVQDNRTLISVYTNIVSLYIKTNKDSLALSYLEKLIPICKSMEDNEKLVLSLINYGVVQERFQNYDLAKQKYIEAITLSETIDFKRGRFAAHYSLANYYYNHANYNLALSNALDAYEEVDEIVSLDEKKSTVELISKIYEGLNNYKEAYKFHVIFKTYTDSLYNESNTEEITNLKNQYEFEKEKDSIVTEQIKKDAIKEAELNRQKFARNSFIVGFALMLIFALIIFRNLAKIRKVNKQLAVQKE